jgi:hypothetical protein
MLRMTARSSTRCDRCGYKSETSIPACPWRAKRRDEPRSVPGLRAFKAGSLSRTGIGCPVRLVSCGLGSKVSTWLTPPYMNKTMHALALAGKCGAFKAKGESGDGPVSEAADASAKKPSPASKAVKAVPTKPPPASQRNSRRVRPHGVKARAARRSSKRVMLINRTSVHRAKTARRSIAVDELIHVQNNQAKCLEGFPPGVGGFDVGVGGVGLDLASLLVQKIKSGL